MDREDREEAWLRAARRARVALLVGGVLALLPAGAGARAQRPTDFAGCEKRPVTIEDFPAELDGGPGAAQQEQIDRVLERIRASFAGCGRSPGYDWIEVRGYASGDEGDAKQVSQQRAETARGLLRAGIGDELADTVRFEFARGEGVPPAPDGEGDPAESRSVAVHLCRTFGPFHRNLGTIEDASLARYAKSGDRFEQAEMRAVRDQLLLWSDVPGIASPIGRITKRFWDANGACRGEELLRRLERVRGDYYDYHVRPHEYELGRLRERGATPAEIRGSQECRALLSLLEDSEKEPSMARIFRERLREDTEACRPPAP